MPAVSSAGTRPPSRRFPRSLAWVVAIALVAAAATALWLRNLDREALHELSFVQPAPQLPADAAHVLGSIRQLKLVTVELATHAGAESAEESWRGDVRARVDAPVKLHFGTDLARLRAESVRTSPLGNSWIVVVPPPQRVATEVFGEREQTDVHVGWFRSRGMSGEKHLGLARRDLYEAARRLTLTEDDRQLVRMRTREQVATLVRSIVGQWSTVTVRFEDELDNQAALGTDR